MMARVGVVQLGWCQGHGQKSYNREARIDANKVVDQARVAVRSRNLVQPQPVNLSAKDTADKTRKGAVYVGREELEGSGCTKIKMKDCIPSTWTEHRYEIE